MANNTYQAVIDAINALLADTNLQLFTEGVIDRLVSFGYEPSSDDVFPIAFDMEKSKNHILAQINHAVIPDGLTQVYVDMVCGEFMKAKYQAGQLASSGINTSDVIKSVTEGDTTVTFETSGSDEATFGGLINYLISGREGDLLCYRKLRW